jgi:hypothetical protein
MHRAAKALILSAAVALVSAPMQARADGFVVPWAGVNWGSSLVNEHHAFGATAGWMGSGLVGGAVDFGYNPSLFGNSSDYGTNKVIDVMGNAYVRIPIGGLYGVPVHPYVTGGLGYIRSQLDGFSRVAINPVTNNNFGWNAGGGVTGFFTEHVGVRGDIRYLRSFENINTGIPSLDFKDNAFRQLNYWRVSGGVVLR